MKGDKLAPKQRLFVAEYMVDLNATQAAIRAGYSIKTANKIGPELLGKTSITEAIAEQLKNREARTLVTADYVIRSLVNVAERCQQAEEVLDRQGNPTGEYRFDSSGANKALELLGKNLKLWTEKTEVTGKDGAPIALQIAWIGENAK